MSGRTGRVSYAVGEYVGPSSNALVMLVRQDPMYVAFPVPQRVLLEVRRQGRSADSVFVRLKLPDGSIYEHDGVINFAEVEGNAGTDTVTVRASVPSPKRLLIDQQLVGVAVVSKEPERKLVVSQSALMLDQQGASVLVVNKDSKVESRRVELGEQRGPDIVVVKGLTEGEWVIVSGHQKVRPGITVEAHQAQHTLTATTR
jgi:membrane fusion protein (multidrug efflux system)